MNPLAKLLLLCILLVGAGATLVRSCMPEAKAETSIANVNGKPVLVASIPETVKAVDMAAIYDASKLLPDGAKVILNIDSYGGDFVAAKTLIHTLKMRHPVTCIGRNKVMSAAYYIFLHCDERFVTPGTVFAFHWIVVNYDVNPPSDSYLENLLWMAKEQLLWDGVGAYVMGIPVEMYAGLRNRGEISAEELAVYSRNKWFKFVQEDK